jgi:hypothetical protein
VNGLGQIRAAVIRTLTDAGLCAAAAHGGAAERYSGPVTAVGVAELTGRPMALGGYLGQTYDRQAGTMRELYGRKMDVLISLDVRADSAAACESACEAVSDALETGGLPSGLRPGEESWEAVCWDRQNQLFLRRGKLKCGAYFTAQTDPEADTLLEFTLKGVLKT